MTVEEVQHILLEAFPFLPTEGQRSMVADLSRFFIHYREPSIFLMKGYAGTGKTTVVSALVKSLPRFRLQAVLLAPTGRAAKVLSTYSGQAAYTIHKKIYTTRVDEWGQRKMVLNRNIHRNTLFIVDEASMIPDWGSGDGESASRSLLEDLFSYVRQGILCKLILVGDQAQLPPVGVSESPALDADFLQATFGGDIYQNELREVVRQADDSGILYNATLLRCKLMQGDYTLPFFELESYADILRIDGSDLEDALHTAYTRGSKEEVAIVTRSNKRANLFNQEVRNRILFQEELLSGGDLMMVLKNNYYWLPKESEIPFIANGDMLRLERIRKIEELYGFRFADVQARLTDYPEHPPIEVKLVLDTLDIPTAALSRERSFELWKAVEEDYQDIPTKSKRLAEMKKNPYLNALQVKFAYALTAHKTQGGQWDTIFIDAGYLPDEGLDEDFLRWMYTALTRATRQVYLVNFKEDFFRYT